jgi:hypothetical protein
VVEEAIVDLLKDKPYMKVSAPRPPVEDNDNTSDDSDQEDTGQVQQPPTPDQLEQLHPNTIVLPVETRPIKELRDGARRSSTRERKRPASYIEESYSEGESVWEENGELVRGVNVLEQINAHMETDDNDNEARIASQYRMLTMHDPEFLTIPREHIKSGCTQGSRRRTVQRGDPQGSHRPHRYNQDPTRIDVRRGQGYPKVLADWHHIQVQA